MPTSLVIASAQTTPLRGDIEANCRQHVAVAHAAALRGASTVVFPELSLIGYELDLLPSLVLTPSDSRLNSLRAAAERLQCTLVVGAPALAPAGVHIAAYILTPEGAVEVYHKHHLGSGEEKAVQAGTNNPFVRLQPRGRAAERDKPAEDRWGSAAIAVCADANHATHAQAAADRGVDAYLVGSFIEPDAFEDRSRMLRDYASSHEFCVALANYGARTGGCPSAGRSSIWSEHGDCVVAAPTVGAAVAIARRTDGAWSGEVVPIDPPSATSPSFL